MWFITKISEWKSNLWKLSHTVSTFIKYISNCKKLIFAKLETICFVLYFVRKHIGCCRWYKNLIENVELLTICRMPYHTIIITLILSCRAVANSFFVWHYQHGNQIGTRELFSIKNKHLSFDRIFLDYIFQLWLCWKILISSNYPTENVLH